MRWITCASFCMGMLSCLPAAGLNAQPPTFDNASHSRIDSRFYQESATTGSRPGAPAEWEPKLEDSESDSPWDEPIETDRHDFTQSPKVVGRGVRQFEFGVLYTNRTEDDQVENSYATPELLFRYGLTDRLELRARFNYAWKQLSDGPEIDGGQDLILATKFQIAEQSGWRPDAALELRSSAPTGGEATTTGRWQFGIDYIYGWKLGEYFTLSSSSGANGNALGDLAFIDPESDRNDQFIAWTKSLALGAKLTRRTTGYFEWFGIYTHGREEERSLSYLNAGVDYLVSKNLVLDARIGWGLTADADDLFAGLGGGFRY